MDLFVFLNRTIFYVFSNIPSNKLLGFQLILRAKPHESLLVLQNVIDGALRESLLQSDMLKFKRPVLGEEAWRQAEHEQEREAHGFEPRNSEITKNRGDGSSPRR